MSIYSGRVFYSDQLSRKEVQDLWEKLFLEESDSHGLRIVHNPEVILPVIIEQIIQTGALFLTKDEDVPIGFLATTSGAYVGTPTCGMMVLGAYAESGYREAGVLSSLFFALRGFCRERGIESVQFAVAEGNEKMGRLAEEHARIVGRVFEKRMLP